MAPSNSQAAASLMLRALLWCQSKARKDSLISHGRLAFCTATKILLAFISRAAGSTDATWRKSAIEEKMFRKVILSSALIFFFAKDICTIKVTFICIWNRVRSVSFSDGGSRNCSWHNIQRSSVSCILFSWLRGEFSVTRSFSLECDLTRSPY